MKLSRRVEEDVKLPKRDSVYTAVTITTIVVSITIVTTITTTGANGRKLKISGSVTKQNKKVMKCESVVK